MNAKFENVNVVELNTNNIADVAQMMNIMGILHGHESQDASHFTSKLNKDILEERTGVKIFVFEDKENSNKPLAYTTVTPLVDEKGRRGVMLEDMIVHPDARSKGYGLLLEDFVANYADVNGLDFVRLLSASYNSRMIGLNNEVVKAEQRGYNAYIQPEKKYKTECSARKLQNADIMAQYKFLAKEYPEQFAALKRSIVSADETSHMVVGSFDKDGKLVSASVGSITYASSPIGYGYVSEPAMFFTKDAKEKSDATLAMLNFTQKATKENGWDMDVVHRVNPNDRAVVKTMSHVAEIDKLPHSEHTWVEFYLAGNTLRSASRRFDEATNSSYRKSQEKKMAVVRPLNTPLSIMKSKLQYAKAR